VQQRTRCAEEEAPLRPSLSPSFACSPARPGGRVPAQWGRRSRTDRQTDRQTRQTPSTGGGALGARHRAPLCAHWRSLVHGLPPLCVWALLCSARRFRLEDAERPQDRTKGRRTKGRRNQAAGTAAALLSARCPWPLVWHVVLSSRPVARLGRQVASIPPACAWSRVVGV
jgi:hypothetical protein